MNVWAFLFSAVAIHTVPIADEPHHHLMLENTYVRVFDVTLPPGEAMLFHIHSHPRVAVIISGAELINQELGRPPARPAFLETGRVGFGGPHTHRESNVGSTTLELVLAEILAPAVGAGTGSVAPEDPTYSFEGESEYVRVYRRILEAGQSTLLHTHTRPSLGVTIAGAALVEDCPGAPPRNHPTHPGQLAWHEAGTTHSIRNVDSSRFEGVDIEWK
jgi:quercetin dioxygenase-like cupin family protein